MYYLLGGIIGLFITLFLIILSVYITYMKRAKKLNKDLDNIKTEYIRNYKNFKIINPYATKGKYYKAQLHTHSNKSDGRLTPAKLIKKYKDKGYSFLAITDHNKVISYEEFNDSNFITITGEEMTYPCPFKPLGQHLLRLFVKEKIKLENLQEIIDKTTKNRGIIIINHPSTISGLGTQCWDLKELLKLNNFSFIEISNHFSNEKNNIKYWHELLKKNGPENPIWGIASDDTHKKEDIDNDWLMVKVVDISEEALYKTLKKGAFYSTQGPILNFTVEENHIKVNSNKILQIKFINANNKLLQLNESSNCSYQVKGNEGFIRIEAIDKSTACKAWSQPFWLKKTSILNEN